MKSTVIGIMCLALLSACSLTPPAPTPCKGEFRPVNGSQGQRKLSAAESAVLCRGEVVRHG